jgi:hypothetical protein
MAQATLRFGRSIFLALIIGLLVNINSSSQPSDKPIGMTLLFQSSSVPVGVLRFDPDSRRGPVPGAVGGMYPRGGAEISFMPDDNRHSLPKFVDVQWMVATPAYDDEWKTLSERADKYSKKWMADAKKINAKAPHYTKRIDLTPIITSELINQVRSDSQNMQLKLIITFDNDEVYIKALADKWR